MNAPKSINCHYVGNTAQCLQFWGWSRRTNAIWYDLVAPRLYPTWYP